MHEMSLAEGVREIVEAAAQTHGVSALRAVVLEIGALSCVAPEALKFALNVVLKGSAANGAAIIIEEIAGAGWCLACDTKVPLASLAEACPLCGSYRVQPVEGLEMRVKELLLP